MRRILRFCAWVFCLAVVALVGAYLMVRSSASGRTYANADALPKEDRVAVVLGCAKTLPGGWGNMFFNRRIKAAAELYQSGKCRALIVSGDNHVEGYDEPTDMKDALIAAGVPEKAIYCDFAGFRTLDSVVRAKAIFGQTKVIFVSQRFHNERAIYLAGQYGMDAIGLNAKDVPMEWAMKTYTREAFARVKAVLDTSILKTQPKFYGPPVQIAQD